MRIGRGSRHKILDAQEFLVALERFVKHPTEEEWHSLHDTWFDGWYCLIAIDNDIDGKYICDDLARDDELHEDKLDFPLCPFDQHNKQQGPCADHLTTIPMADRLQCCIEILTDLSCRK